MRHGQVDHRFAALGERLVVLTQSPVATQPSEGALHDPALGQHHEAGYLVAALDDLQNPVAQLPRPVDQLAGIAAVGPNQFEPWEASLEFGQHQLGPVAVLDVRRMHHHGQYHTQRIYDQMAFSALDFLARVVSPRPPFCTVLTDWLSMMAAEG